jgi:hypothetical protein
MILQPVNITASRNLFYHILDKNNKTPGFFQVLKYRLTLCPLWRYKRMLENN